MFLISQIVAFAIGTYFQYSEKKPVRVIGRVLQVLGGLAIILSFILLAIYHHHHPHSHLS